VLPNCRVPPRRFASLLSASGLTNYLRNRSEVGRLCRAVDKISSENREANLRDQAQARNLREWKRSSSSVSSKRSTSNAQRPTLNSDGQFQLSPSEHSTISQQLLLRRLHELDRRAISITHVDDPLTGVWTGSQRLRFANRFPAGGGNFLQHGAEIID